MIGGGGFHKDWLTTPASSAWLHLTSRRDSYGRGPPYSEGFHADIALGLSDEMG